MNVDCKFSRTVRGVEPDPRIQNSGLMALIAEVMQPVDANGKILLQQQEDNPDCFDLVFLPAANASGYRAGSAYTEGAFGRFAREDFEDFLDASAYRRKIEEFAYRLKAGRLQRTSSY